MARTNKTKFALLGMLMNRPMSGYDLKKFSDQSIAHFWSENYGHIYPILKRMETEGLASKRSIQREGKPVRHVYRITEKGRDLFLKWLRIPAERDIHRNEFLLKLFFAEFLQIQDVLSLVESERSRNAQVLEKYHFLGREIINKTSWSGAKKFVRLTLSYGEKLGQARIEWCEEVLRDLTEKNAPGE
jgi:PadR family transcriptional regulator AphA